MKKNYTILGLLIALFANAQNCSVTLNSGFDSVDVTSSSVALVDASAVAGWKTTSSDNKMEIWANGYSGVNSYSGIQFIEINATQFCTVSQDFSVTPGTNLSISFAHRGRGPSSTGDTVLVSIGPAGGPYVSLGRFGDPEGAWVYRTLNYSVPTGAGNNYSLRFTAVHAGYGNPAIGNFLDAVNVCKQTVGVKEHELNSVISVGPNPAANNFTIKLLNVDLIGESIKLKIYDVQGKLIKDYNNQINSDNEEFDITDLNNGIYYYDGNIGNQHFSGKLSVLK